MDRNRRKHGNDHAGRDHHDHDHDHPHEKEDEDYRKLSELRRKVSNISNYKIPTPFWKDRFFINHDDHMGDHGDGGGGECDNPECSCHDQHDHGMKRHGKGAVVAYNRKNQKNLTAAERDTFRVAILDLINEVVTVGGSPRSFYGEFVAIHADPAHRMHSMNGAVGRQRFLPWHRIYLLELEVKIRAKYPGFSIPYWDWVNDRAIPPWIDSFRPTVTVNGTPVTVTRLPGLPANLPTAASVNTALSSTSYTQFTQRLEGNMIHNRVHTWVSGTMGSIPVAPADPLFWLHHANIDRLWAQWQSSHPGMNPSLAGASAILDPWMEFDEVDSRSTEALGYVYS